ncbi:MAG: ATP-binding cassette domain-containing protein [Clostridia bacterium]|nr:ATP-binding cassette domain-containing protein [Clostridia bacterium]
MKIINLSFRYPDQKKLALQNIDLTIEKGQFILLCGDSGSGKSTLLKLLKKEIAPRGDVSGNIVLFGKKIADLDERESVEKIGFVAQSCDTQLVCETVRRELAFKAESLGFPSSEIRCRVAELALYFGLSGMIDKKICNLSGGEKQLLSLAASVICIPKILILDEPCAQLDPISSKKIVDYIRRLNREFGITIIVSEHRTDDFFIDADKVAVLSEGKLISCKSPKETVIDENIPDYLLPAVSRIYRKIKVANDSDIIPVDILSCQLYIYKYCTPEMIQDLIDDIEINSSNAKNIMVSLHDVYYFYDKKGMAVLRGLTLDVKKGEVLAVLGGNGSGKTTLLNLIAGVYKCSSGKIKTKYRRCVILPQNIRDLFLMSTVREDLFLSGEISDDIIKTMNLENLLDRHPFDLSGGEIQRSGIAKLMTVSPDLILLDEPTKGMDRKTTMQLCGIISSLKNSGTTVVIVTHDTEMAEMCADRCAFLFNGEIVSAETTSDFFNGLNFFTTEKKRILRSFIKK